MNENMKQRLIHALCLLLLITAPAAARQKKNPDLPLPQMYVGEVQRIIDGDTIVVKVQLWPTITSTLSVRILGIDVPDARDRCPEAQKIRQQAKDFVGKKLLAGDRRIHLTKIGKDKYGRGLARIKYQTRKNWMKLDLQLLKKHLACPYDGGTKRIWCQNGKINPCWKKRPSADKG